MTGAVLGTLPEWVQDGGGLIGILLALVGLLAVGFRWLRTGLAHVVEKNTARLQADVEAIRHEVLADSGESLRDAIDRIEAVVHAHGTQLAVLEALIQTRAGGPHAAGV